MKILKIYITHSLTDAPESFLQRMRKLRQTVRDLPQIKVLDFAWEHGPQFNAAVNVYEYDIVGCVHEADLMISVLDFISAGTSMEIQARCHMGAALACFLPQEKRLSKMIGDCIRFHRRKLLKTINLPDPMLYSNDQEIIRYIEQWIKKYRQAP